MSLLHQYNFRGINLVGDVFIETGSFFGDTFDLAIRQSYKTCHTVEVSEAHFLFCKEKFSGRPNVFVHRGSSPEVLLHIIDPTQRTTFWLDAHYVAVGTDRVNEDAKYGECPIIAELDAIFSFKWEKPPIIIIDDSHMFVDNEWSSGGHPLHLYDRNQWPSRSRLAALMPGYTFQEDNEKLYCIHEDHNW